MFFYDYVENVNSPTKNEHVPVVAVSMYALITLYTFLTNPPRGHVLGVSCYFLSKFIFVSLCTNFADNLISFRNKKKTLTSCAIPRSKRVGDSTSTLLLYNIMALPVLDANLAR